MNATTRLTDYICDQPLGQGGMATVFRATYRPTGEVVALKRMLPHIASNEIFVARFVRELETSARLRHENVVRVQGYGKDDDGSYFLALEFCDGGTLVQLLKRVPRLPPDVVILMLNALLAGLEEAHAHGVIHRDIKPPNVLLTTSGRVLLTDFGIARSVADETLTATGEVIGTPAYMSPEQAMGDRTLDGRSDLFAVGMLAYRLLVGSNPFASENVATSILRVTTGPSLRIGDALVTAPTLLELVIDGLVEKDRDRRIASAADARRLLAPLVAQVQGSFPGLLRSLVRDPEGTVRDVVAEAAARELQAARAHLDAEPARAMVHAARAQQLSPADPDVGALVAQLAHTHGFQLQARDQRVAVAEQELETRPDDPAVLRRLANLHRGLNNPLEAARYLKRYLQLRPDDALAQQQLAALLGQDDVALYTGSARARDGSGRLRTADIVEGIKTGGRPGGSVPASGDTPGLARPVQRSPGRVAGSGTFGGHAVIVPETRGVSILSWVFRGIGLLAVIGVVVVVVTTVRYAVRPRPTPSGPTRLENTLGGLTDGTQQPFLARAQQAATVGDWQGVIESANFGLSADPEKASRTTPSLLLVRAQAYQALGQPRQAIADARLARGLFPPGPDRDAAVAVLKGLEGPSSSSSPSSASSSSSSSSVSSPSASPAPAAAGPTDPILTPTPTSAPASSSSPTGGF